MAESQQGLEGYWVGAGGERIEQGAGFGRDVGRLSAHASSYRADVVRIVEAPCPGRLRPVPGGRSSAG